MYCIVLYFIIFLGHSQQTLRSSYRVPKINEIVLKAPGEMIWGYDLCEGIREA